MQQAWTYNKGVQKQRIGTTPKEEIIIILEDMED